MTLNEKMSFSQNLPQCRMQTIFYSCKFCRFETRHMILLERHMKRCSNSFMTPNLSDASSLYPLPAPSVCRNYKCSKCSFVSNKAKLFLYHQRQVHGENIAVYGCNECEYASRHKNKVLRHKRLVHKVISSADDILALEDQCLTNLSPKDNDAATQRTVNNDDEHNDNNKPMLLPEDIADSNLDLADSNDIPNQFSVPNPNLQMSGLDSSDRTVGKNEKKLDCDLTSDYTSKWVLLKVNAADGLYRCKFCRYSNPHKWKIASHMRTSHSRKTSYKCSQCSFVTERKIEWCAHKTLHSGKAIYSCGECAYQTTMKRNFERHQERHLVNGPRRCSLCSYSSTGEGAIQRHMAEYHPPSPGKAETNFSEEIQASEEINKDVTVLKSSLAECSSDNNNSIVQSVFSTAPQSYCSAAISSTSSYSITQSISSVVAVVPSFHDQGIRNSFHCRDRFELSKPAASCTNESRWTCSLCPLGYKRAADLNRHMKRKHGISLKDITVTGSKSNWHSQSSISTNAMISSYSVTNSCSRVDGNALQSIQSVPIGKHVSNFAKYSTDNNSSVVLISEDQPLNLSLKRSDDTSSNDLEQLEVLDLSTKLQLNAIRETEVSPSNCYLCANKMQSETEEALEQLSCVNHCTRALDVQLNMPKDKKIKNQANIVLGAATKDSSIFEGSVSETVLQKNKTYSVYKKLENLEYQQSNKKHHCHFCDYKAIWKIDLKDHLTKCHHAEIRQQDGIRELLDMTYQLCDDENNINCTERNSRVQYCFADGKNDDCVDYNMNVEVNDESIKREEESLTSFLLKDRRLRTCPIPNCKFVSESPSKLKVHIESHDTLRRFMCMYCGKRYSWLWDIRRHIRHSHPGVDMSIRELSDEEVYSESCADFQSMEKNREGRPQISTLKEESRFENLQETSTISDKGNHRNSLTKTDSVDVEKLAEQYANEVAAMFYGGNSHSSPEDNSTKLIKSWDQEVTAPSPILFKRKFGRPSKSLLMNRFRPFKCSECGRRSNWRWDLNKHIRVSHPGAHLIEMTETEAKLTFHEVVCNDFREKQQLMRVKESAEARFKPYMCDHCGFRSNWKCDIDKHMRTTHPLARMVILEKEQAKAAIVECTAQLDALSDTAVSVAPSDKGSISFASLCVTVDSRKLKRFKCSVCPYRSNFRSDVGRHIRHKHDKGTSRIIVMNENEAAETLKEYMETWARKKFVSSPSKKRSAFSRHRHGQSFLSITTKELPYQKENRDEAMLNCTFCDFRGQSKKSITEHQEQGICVDKKVKSLNFSLNSGSETRFKRNANEFTRETTTKEDAPQLMETYRRKNVLNCRNRISTKSFSCNICPYKTNKTGLLNIHKTYHHPNGRNKYKCHYCPYFVSASLLLHQHMRLHFRDDDDDNDSSSSKSKQNSQNLEAAKNNSQQVHTLQSSRKTTSSKTTFCCTKCPYASSNRNDYIYHRQFHRIRNTPSFKCNQCPYWVSQKSLLIKHTKVHTDEYQYKWSTAVNLEPSSENGPQHIEVHALENCSVSSRDVMQNISKEEDNKARDADISCKKNHEHKYPRSSKVRSSVISNAKKFECSYCPYVTLEQSLLEGHLTKHDSGQQFKCNMCNFSISSLHQLRRHKKLHECRGTDKQRTTDETCESRYDSVKKVFCCDKCPYSNARRDHLMCHIKFHLNKSDLQCPLCSYSVSRVHLLNQHLKVHGSFTLSAQNENVPTEEPAYDARQKKNRNQTFDNDQLSNDSQTSFVVWMRKKVKMTSNLLPQSSSSDENSNSDSEKQLKKRFMYKLKLQSSIVIGKDGERTKEIDNVCEPIFLTQEETLIQSLACTDTEWK